MAKPDRGIGLRRRVETIVVNAAKDNQLFKIFAYFLRFWRAIDTALSLFLCSVMVDDC